MRKGRVALAFWLMVVLALVTSTATYAWISMNLSSYVGGIAVKLATDTKYLQISAHPAEGYSNAISFGEEHYIFGTTAAVEQIYLTAYGYLPEKGGLIITSTEITEINADELGFHGGKYYGTARLYSAEESDISETEYGYRDVTASVSEGDSVIGLYLIADTGEFHKTAAGDGYTYYYRHERTGATDYVCVGSFDAGESLSGRRYWGYAVSDNEQSAESDKMLNVVSMDVPATGYALKRDVYIQASAGSGDLRNLRVSSVEVNGLRNYLTDALRIMFVATSNYGAQKIFFYDHSTDSDTFEGVLFEQIRGDRAETITVEVYIFFDGTHENAYSDNSVFSNHSVEIQFSVDIYD